MNILDVLGWKVEYQRLGVGLETIAMDTTVLAFLKFSILLLYLKFEYSKNGESVVQTLSVYWVDSKRFLYV